MTLQQGGPFIGMGDNLGRMWARIVKPAEVQPITVHDSRRTYVTRLLELGVPLKVVKELTGHESIVATAEYYQQVNHQHRREAVARLQRDVG